MLHYIEHSDNVYILKHATVFINKSIPVFVPPVNIHAPVVLAAFNKPFRKIFFRLG